MAGLYVHIPFCVKRCSYCDFYSQTNLGLKHRLVEALVKELELRKDYLKGEALETIYFGGGTPSLLEPKDFEVLFDAITQCFDTTLLNESTLEVNPDDITPAFLTNLKQFPFNRISMGIQSFNDTDLQLLNRRHNRVEAINALQLLRKFGYENISLDLMYGLPGQTIHAWESNLAEACEVDVPHISAYHLTYEPGTHLYTQLENGEIHPADEELSLRMMELLIEKLTTLGYSHYEISNFSKPGFHSLHNSSYWIGKKYLGIGPSAHSYDGESRQFNVSSIQSYMQGIINQTSFFEKEMLNTKDKYNDFIITRLRTKWGIEPLIIEKQFGSDYLNYFTGAAKPYLEKKLLQKVEGSYIITSKGLYIVDAIMSDLMK